MPKFSAAVMKKRIDGLHELSKGFGVTPAGARYLALKRNVSSEKAAARIKRMRKAKAPLTGMTWALSLSAPEFDAFIARFQSKHKLTAAQTGLFNFLQKTGVSERRAIELVKRGKGRQATLVSMQKKIALLKAIKLASKTYGVERIPVSYYERALHLHLSDLKGGGIKRKVLRPLADAYAVKRLDLILPEWRRMGDLSKRVGPATLLKKVEQAKANGIKPTYTVLLGYSAESISGFKVPANDSMDVLALTHTIDTAQNIAPGRKFVRARNLVLDQVVKRPHLAVKRSWLFGNWRKKQRIEPRVLKKAVEELTDLGALSKQNSYLTVSRSFRTGTTGSEEHGIAVERRTLARQMGWQRRKQRELAMQK
jgi:hypothetical protein